MLSLLQTLWIFRTVNLKMHYPREWMETTFNNIAGGEEFAPWDVRKAIEW